MGQVVAALAAGNSVISKPADQTTLIGYAAIKLLHEAGVPAEVLQFTPCKGSVLGNSLLTKADVAGVCFTGSTETAWTINRTLAARDASIAALIAETGGQNALIADSSALPEQLVKDVCASAFDSAGQRCSAARVLFVQEDIADKVIDMLKGAMAELVMGDPGLLSTDIGPVIDEASHKVLSEHAARMDREAKPIGQVASGENVAHGTFFAPRAYEIPRLDILHKEVFGPILHVLRWKADEWISVIARHQCHRLRAHPRHPQPHQRHRRPHRPTRQGRQLLRQPQSDRRGGRCTAVRWREPLRHWTQSRWSALPVALCHRTHGHHQHHGGGRQCVAIDVGRVVPACPRTGESVRRTVRMRRHDFWHCNRSH